MEWLPCEFFLIEYALNPVRDTRIPIGVILREVEPGGRSLVRFLRDWRQVRCLDADADVGMFEGLEQEIERRLTAGVSLTDTKGVIEECEDSLSTSLRITPSRARLAENLEADMDSLMRMYVDPIKLPKKSVKSGRAAILDKMMKEFEKKRVWKEMRKRIPAAQYTRKGDSLRIDCGYKVGGAVPRATADEILRMFQAVSLAGEGEGASVLAASLTQLRDGVARVEKADLHLTAVVEPLRIVGDPENEEDEAVARYEFGRQRMEEKGIRVMTTNDLKAMAETAQQELGLV